MKKLTGIIVILLLCLNASTQSFNGFTEDERTLYAMNKQVGQFIRRFNMEEDQFGKFLPVKDKRYHNNKLRKDLLSGMFDNQNPRTSGNLKKYFINDVTSSNNPVILSFTDDNWFAEVSTTFKCFGEGLPPGGVDQSIILFLKVEEHNSGTKWVLSNVYSRELNKLFPVLDTSLQNKIFLHPQSHELDFMNIKSAMEDPDKVDYYASTKFTPDYLTLFFYLIKTNQLKFVKVNSVKFHFLQIENWYFELSFFNRNDMNSGWLISNLAYLSENDKPELLKTYKRCIKE